MSGLKIGLYIGSWPQNIGNAFFDLGAKAILQLAFPDATFYNVGGASHWMLNASSLYHKTHLVGSAGRRLLTKLGTISPYGNNQNSLEVGQFADVDMLVFAGMSMCREFAENNGRTFLAAAKRGVAVLGLGAGGSLYDDDEVRSFSEFFGKLPKAALITRDDDTFDMFSSSIKHIERGMDCAFCLPEYYTPPRLDIPAYDVENFDDPQPEQPITIDHGGRWVLRTHHDLWGVLPPHYINQENTLISDVPEDYLTLYSQVTHTYSNRVHACVASLAYGNKARLYSNTPRKALFRRMRIERLTSEVVQLDQDLRVEMKERQVQLARTLVGNMLG